MDLLEKWGSDRRKPVARCAASFCRLMPLRTIIKRVLRRTAYTYMCMAHYTVRGDYYRETAWDFAAAWTRDDLVLQSGTDFESRRGPPPATGCTNNNINNSAENVQSSKGLRLHR